MKTALMLLTCLLLSTSIKAQPTDNGTELTTLAAATLHTQRLHTVAEEEAYAIIQGEEKGGFVVIATDADGRHHIVGYAPEGRWETDCLPPVLHSWMESLRMPSPTEGIDTTTVEKPARRSIQPLLTCHWHQRSPYNDLAPVIADGNKKTVAGCVAIAAAQITYYWRRDNPEATLRDTPTYIYGGAPVTYSVPKGSPNNWELMKDEYTKDNTDEERAAAAQLCYVLGTTSYLNFASATGGHIKTASNAMYSQYQLLSEFMAKPENGYAEWEERLYNELERGHPVLCSGTGSGGHAFVLDGYDNSTKLYHFNFGWGGSGDGYYPVDDSPQSMGGYYTDQSIVCNIHPQARNIEATMTAGGGHNGGPDMTNISLNITINNRSTLPIRRLLVYDGNTENTSPTDSTPAIWENEGTIANDGTTHSIDLSITLHEPIASHELILTDEDKYVLARLQLTEDNSSIVALRKDSDSRQRKQYDLTGKMTRREREKGIRIVQDSSGTRMMVIK